MNPYSQQVLACIDRAYRQGPTLCVQLDAELEFRLVAFKNECLVVVDEELSVYAPPDAEGTKLGVQVEIIVEALLTSKGELVYLDAIWYAQTSPYARDAFGEAVNLILEVPGVEYTA